MRTQGDNRPQAIENIGRGNYYVNMNIEEKTVEGRTFYEYDCVRIVGYPTYGATVEALIRERYTQSDEFAIQRQRESNPEKFAEYNTFCEACKDEARPVFYPNEQ